MDRLAGRRALYAEHVPREIQRLLDRPNSLVLVRRKNFSWIADRNPSDRHERIGRQDRAQMDNAIDAYFGARAHARAVEYGRACGQKNVVRDFTAGQISPGSDQDIVPM